MPDKTVFIDTNCFIQLRDLKDLPWRELFPGVNWLEVVVAPIVIEELDEFKSSREGRRRDRARLALALIEEASRDGNLRCELRAKPFKLSLRLAVAKFSEWASVALLDSNRPDDKLVAAMLADPESSPILLSHDTGPIVRSRLVGLKALKVSESWLLPDNNDSGLRELQKLRAEVDYLRSSKPRIVAQFDELDEDGAIIRPALPVMDRQIIEILRKKFLKMNPEARLSRIGIPAHYGWAHPGPTDEQITNYERSYLAFEKKIDLYLSNLHDLVHAAGQGFAASYAINNESGITCQNMIIEYGCDGRAHMLPDREETDKLVGSTEAPTPPEVPKSQLQSIVDPRMLRSISALNGPNDPQGFYWIDRPALNSTTATLKCAEFRPTRRWSDVIWLVPTRSDVATCRFSLKISGTNLPEPVNIEKVFRFVTKQTKWLDPVVLRLLPSWISEELQLLKNHPALH